MSYQPYSLEVISQHSQFKGKALKKFNINGTDHIGVWGSEPFEIAFKNHTYQKVQVRLTIDGTDILTGKPASTEATSDMWVVQPYATLSLKAWPETTKGGAQFVFTSADKSVAVHTHGDLSSQSFIAAAVYVEGYTIPYNSTLTFGSVSVPNTPYYGSTGQAVWIADTTNTLRSTYTTLTTGTASGFSLTNCSGVSYNSGSNEVKSASLESTAGVGAGTQVSQNISYASGLIKPILQQIINIRYLWWDELKAALKEKSGKMNEYYGFPEDKRVMSLGTTPRPAPVVPTQDFSRV